MKRSSWQRTTIYASVCLSYCASRVTCFGWKAGRTRAPRARSGRRSSLRVSKVPSPSNCARPRALPGYCAIKAVLPMRRLFSSLSSPGLPKGSRRLTSKHRRRFWTIFTDSRSRLALWPERTKWPPGTHKPTYDERCRHKPRIGNLILPFRAGVSTTGAGNAPRGPPQVWGCEGQRGIFASVV